MALILKNIYNELHQFSEYGKGCLIDDYILMGSPLKMLSLLGLYIYFVKSLGPKLMENRKPFQINNILIIYNAAQVILNGLLFVIGTYLFIDRNYSMRCLPLLPRNVPDALLENQLMYCYYMFKVLDLSDTVFFILRKKYNQITFLHVYHHAIMTAFGYGYTKYVPGGHIMMLGLVNCFVHVIMYSYYFLTAFKPELKTSIWWKKHITHVQMLQFIYLFIHFGHPLIFNTCNYPVIANFIPCSQNVVMFLLFANFYIRSYFKKSTKIN